jgi:hypothetical protein
MAAAFALVLLGASMLFSSGSTQASATTNAPGPVAQSEQKGAAQAKETAVARPVGSWSDIAPFPSVSIPPTPGAVPLRLKRANATAYFPNGKLYVLGGRAGTDGDDTTLRNIFEYTPGNPGTWVQKAALLDDQAVGSRWTANMAVATLTDTQGVNIYAIGGTSIDGVPTDRVRVYNPIADTVTNLTTDPWPATPMRNPGAWAVWNNKLYIYGGFSALGAGAVYPETWVFDPLGAPGAKWQRITSADLPVARGFMAGVHLDGHIYAIGGDTWNSGTRQLIPSDLVHRMNPAQPSPTWTAVANLPTARGDLGAWAYDTGTNYEISGRIAVAGGVFPVPDAQGYLYDPGANSWGAFPNLVHPTRNFGFAQLNGYLYAFGGYDYSNGLPQGANWNQRYDATQPIGSPTSTTTGTPPTSTRTSTTGPSTNTPAGTSTTTRTATVDPCLLNNYVISTATGTIVPGTTNIGSSCDDCVTTVTIPFPFRLYDQLFTSAQADSNGKLHFPTGASVFTNSCLPQTGATYTIYPYWDDLRTDGVGGTCPAGGCGIFTSVSGTAPNRIFNIEWRAVYFSGGGTANFEVRLYETTGANSRFDIVYGTLTNSNTSATGGVQRNQTSFTQDFCDGAGGAATGVKVYTLPVCGTVSPTTVASTSTRSVTPVPTQPPATGTSTSVIPTSTSILPTLTLVPSTSTAVSTNTAVRTNTAVSTSTNTSGPATGTSTLVPTSTACTITFSDVPPTDPFYASIRCLACRGIISGYADGTFRTYNPIVRGQIAKVVSNAAGLTGTPTGQRYTDVPPTDTFYVFIERLTAQGAMGGYPCGTRTTEPCDPQQRPYFRPYTNATRGQLAQIVARAAGLTGNPTTHSFTDVPPGSTFYVPVEQLYSLNVMTGVPCGGVNPETGQSEPCDAQSRPYFRPNNTVNRGQASRIIANTFFPNCQTP